MAVPSATEFSVLFDITENANTNVIKCVAILLSIIFSLDLMKPCYRHSLSTINWIMFTENKLEPNSTPILNETEWETILKHLHLSLMNIFK